MTSVYSAAAIAAGESGVRNFADLRIWTVKARAVIENPRVLAAIPVLYIALFAIGVVRGTSPVPFWDMWDSTVWFYLNVRDNGWGELLRFQNEHRIVFSKILFWIDYQYFDARSTFLVAANFALLLGLWITLTAIAQRLLGPGALWIAVSALLSVFCLSWLHEDNVTWGFQSQFIVAYLFPLLAFACLALSAEGERSIAWFLAAAFFGVASLGTMANGLLALPLLIVMQILLPQPAVPTRLLRAVVLAVIAVIGAALWFEGYYPRDSTPATPLGMALFFTSYLGIPFVKLTGSTAVGIVGALFFAGLSLFFLGAWWRRRAQQDPLILGVLAMLAYVAATGLLLAYGRGETHNAALIPRYATPSFMGWSALLILAAAWLKSRADSLGIFARCAVVGAVVFLPIQLEALGTYGPLVRHMRMHAALALQLGLYDPGSLRFIFMADKRDYYEYVKTGADRLAALNRSIFADPLWPRAFALLGRRSGEGVHPCTFAVDESAPVPGEARARAVNGWVVDEAASRQPAFAYFTAAGRIVGIAVVGAPRPDVARSFGRKAAHSGFSGYALEPYEGPLTVACPDSANPA